MLITLYKHDKRGRTWYYSLDDRQQSLFAPCTLTVQWGTDLLNGAKRQFTFDSPTERDNKVREILRAKLKDYKVLYSYFKDQKIVDEPASGPDQHGKLGNGHS